MESEILPFERNLRPSLEKGGSLKFDKQQSIEDTFSKVRRNSEYPDPFPQKTVSFQNSLRHENKASMSGNMTGRSESRTKTWRPALKAKAEQKDTGYLLEPTSNNPENFDQTLRTDRSKRSSSAMKAWRPSLVAPKTESKPTYITEPTNVEPFDLTLRATKKTSRELSKPTQKRSFNSTNFHTLNFD